MTPCQDVFPTVLAGLILYLPDYLCIIRASGHLVFKFIYVYVHAYVHFINRLSCFLVWNLVPPSFV